MIVFLDTEFTSLQEPNLLSLGIVTLDGSEHYVELDLDTEEGRARKQQSSAFVLENVLDMWRLVPEATCSYSEMGQRTADWLSILAEETGASITIGHDFWIDYALLRECLQEAGRWRGLAGVLHPLDLQGLTGSREGQLATAACLEEIRERGMSAHHALADAWALRAAYLAVGFGAR